MNVVVRLADRDEAEGLARLHRESAIAGYRHIFPAEAVPPTHELLLGQWGRTLRDGGRRVFVADRGHDVVGVVVAGGDPDDPALGHVARFYVRPRHWARGVGRRLHDTALGHLRSAGFPEARLWVLEGNVRARSWYERLGWRCTGERRHLHGEVGIDDVRYGIVL